MEPSERSASSVVRFGGQSDNTGTWSLATSQLSKVWLPSQAQHGGRMRQHLQPLRFRSKENEKVHVLHSLKCNLCLISPHDQWDEMCQTALASVYVPEAGDVIRVTIPKANLKCFYNKMCRFYKHKHKFIYFWKLHGYESQKTSSMYDQLEKCSLLGLLKQIVANWVA